MKTKILLICIVLFSFHAIAGQSKCTLTKKELPKVRNLQLGMDLQSIQQLYPTMRTTQLGFIEGTAVADPPIKNPFPDVEAIDVSIEGHKLVSFEIWYQPRVYWASAKEFAQYFAKSLGISIPHSAWEIKNTRKEKFAGTHCKDFSITFTVTSDNKYKAILTGDDFVDEIIKSSQQKKESFKP